MKLVDEKQSELIKMQLVTFERVHVPSHSTVTVDLVIEQFSAAIWQESSSGSDGKSIDFDLILHSNNYCDCFVLVITTVCLDYDYYVVPGTYNLWVGGQQPGQTMKLSSNLLQGSFTRSIRYLLSDCKV